MGNHCNSKKKKNTLILQHADPQINHSSLQNLIPNQKLTEISREEFLMRKRSGIEFEELNETLNFLIKFTNERQIYQINELLTKPIQLKINPRVAKYLPQVFCSNFEQDYIRNFPYSPHQTIYIPSTKNPLFSIFNKEILEKATKKKKSIEKADQNSNLKATKPPKFEKKRCNSLKKVQLQQKKPYKSEQVKKKEKSRSISQLNHKANGPLRINLIPLIEKERKERIEAFFRGKTKKKEYNSTSFGNNSAYYKLFSYKDRREVEDRYKKKVKGNEIKKKVEVSLEKIDQRYQNSDYFLGSNSEGSNY